MKIRIGNDIHIVWTILKEDKPYILNDNVKVKLLDPFNKPVVCEYTIKNNIIDVIYRGKTQVTYGKYSLLLIENEDIDDMISVDARDIFELTKRTYKNIGDNKTDVMIDVPEITSNVGIGQIYDDTQVKADIQKNADNITANSKAIKLKADKTELTNLATKEEVNAAKYDDTQVKSDIKTNADNINLKANRKDINEYNITQLFGIGCNTLQDAVNNLNNYLTEDLKITGIRIVFINLTDRIETWEYKGHGISDIFNWEEIKKYELPIATNSVLGGVMPETKTDEMTQVVGVDAVGKLYTKDFKYDLPVANFTTLGGVKPVAKTEKMTKDVGVDAEGKLYVEIPTVEPYDDTQVKADIQTNADNIALKQDKLVSGTNIKTINNVDILGTGNITIEGGTGGESNYIITDDLSKIANPKDGMIAYEQKITAAGGYFTTDALYFINTIPGRGKEFVCVINNDTRFTVDINYTGTGLGLKGVPGASFRPVEIYNNSLLVNEIATDDGKYKIKFSESGNYIKMIVTDNSGVIQKYYIDDANVNESGAMEPVNTVFIVGTNLFIYQGKWINYKEKLDFKQDTLVSGKNVKTVNNESILGEGNINIAIAYNQLVNDLSEIQNPQEGYIAVKRGAELDITATKGEGVFNDNFQYILTHIGSQTYEFLIDNIKSVFNGSTNFEFNDVLIYDFTIHADNVIVNGVKYLFSTDSDRNIIIKREDNETINVILNNPLPGFSGPTIKGYYPTRQYMYTAKDWALMNDDTQAKATITNINNIIG